MSDPRNDPTAQGPSGGYSASGQPGAGVPYGGQAPGGFPASYDTPGAFTPTPKKSLPGPVDEAPWVRSIYLFGACATGGVMMIVGLFVAVASLIAVISPDSGLRDGWDRGLVGVTEVADQGLDVFEEFTRAQEEADFDSFCAEAIDDPFCDDLAERIEAGESVIPDEVTESIGLIRDEVHRQIRISSIAKLAGGLVLAIAGLFLFRFHSKQVTVYRRS